MGTERHIEIAEKHRLRRNRQIYPLWRAAGSSDPRSNVFQTGDDRSLLNDRLTDKRRTRGEKSVRTHPPVHSGWGHRLVKRIIHGGGGIHLQKLAAYDASRMT